MRLPLLLFVPLAACTASPTGFEDQDPMAPIDEGKVIATYDIRSDFKTDFGADPALTRAIDILRPLKSDPAGVIGEWMSTAALGLEYDVYSAVSTILADSPYLAETWKLDELTDERGYRTFLLNQDLDVIEKDGKRTLRDKVFGVTLWAQDIDATGSTSWAVSAPIASQVVTSDVTYRLEGDTLVVDRHQLQVPLADVVRVMFPGEDVGLALTLFIDCNIIATRVAQQVPVQASALAAGCVSGAQKMGDDFKAAVAAINSRIEFSISATIKVTDSNADGTTDTVQDGRWVGSYTTPWKGETVLGETSIKQWRP